MHKLLGCLVVLPLFACPGPMRTITPDEVVARGDCAAVTGAGAKNA